MCLYVCYIYVVYVEKIGKIIYIFFVSNDLAPSVSNGTLLCLARLSAQNVNLHSAEESLKTAGCATNY